ncbi:glycosyltransferase family 2 protein [Dyadobacter sp. CY345]|uniref:glycosyltransferase family 2 protein n=1 Tax=Dyadobacter sp. CY345 TaxID=2909335 RepID=UPI001F27570E|nr:glycosyltransferase family 2 protein [Dyadobacter sp. CY345]MCF2447018.1 glycosyltransferase family 2 protein [Dyadobacter sp. CY345]
MKFISATSLVIATYNWAEALQCCLISVARQKILPAEVIIADDGSDYRTREIVQRFQADFQVPIIHVWHEDLGFRKTIILNKAVSQSNGEYLIQVDGDVILHPNFVQDHLAAASPDCFVRGSRARLTAAKSTELLNSFDTDIQFYSPGVYHRLNAVRLPFFRSLGQRKEMKSRSVRGSNLAFWKADFIKVNGYNNALNGWGHEDEELAARFINNNIVKKIVKLSAVQFHLHHSELSRLNESHHSQILQETLTKKFKICPNGYENLH